MENILFLLGDGLTSKISVELLVQFSKAVSSLGMQSSYVSEGNDETFTRVRDELMKGSIAIRAEEISKIETSCHIIVCSIPIDLCSSESLHVLR